MDFPYGEILKDIPSGFTPPEMWPEYGFVADPATICRREIVQDNPVAVRWSLWPLTFEQYWGDKEPDIAAASNGALAYNRIALWRRLHEGPTPRGWHRGLPSIFRVDGYQHLADGDFTERWNKNARRDLRLWQENFLDKTHRIEEVSFEEITEIYPRSLTMKHEGGERLENLKAKFVYPVVREHTKFWGVRDTASGTLVAGTGIVFSPSHKSSTHLAPFILEEARHIYAATALVEKWFRESSHMGCPTVMTLNFWHKGKPKTWKGFSEFKSHFGWHYVTYPPILWRFVRGKLW